MAHILPTNTDETIERLQRAVESAFGQMYEYVRGGGFSTRGAPGLNIRDVAQEPTSPTDLGEQVYLRFQEAGGGGGGHVDFLPGWRNLTQRGTPRKP